jgi:ribosomal protein S18 acetylase RimI-like enzyme
MYALTETNMRKMYEQTWGWNSLEKRRELNHQNAKFVFAVEKKKKKKKKCDDGRTKSEEDEELPVAFAHFRFEVDDDDVASVYIYELQVERTKKRLGLGRLLMRACEKIAVELGLKHMALTVLKKNEGARAFYEKIGYEETDHAPADAHYVILRKRV